jgi:hypothetical protein
MPSASKTVFDGDDDTRTASRATRTGPSQALPEGPHNEAHQRVSVGTRALPLTLLDDNGGVSIVVTSSPSGARSRDCASSRLALPVATPDRCSRVRGRPADLSWSDRARGLHCGRRLQASRRRRRRRYWNWRDRLPRAGPCSATPPPEVHRQSPLDVRDAKPSDGGSCPPSVG